VNHAEFAEWLDYHGTAFPSVGDWITKNRDTLGHWARALEDVDFESAKAATDAMSAGELDAHGHGQHARVVRRWCKSRITPESQPAMIVDGEETYRCADCLDSGTRLVIHHDTLRGIVRGDHDTTQVVACECESGERWRRGVKPSRDKAPRRLPTFDGRLCFPVTSPIVSESERQACMEWISNGATRAAGMSNAENFGDYGF